MAAVIELTDEQREDYRTEQRRMWCLTQAMSVAFNVAEAAPKLPTIDIVKTAEEMAEFIETGVARTASVSRAKQ